MQTVMRTVMRTVMGPGSGARRRWSLAAAARRWARPSSKCPPSAAARSRSVRHWSCSCRSFCGTRRWTMRGCGGGCGACSRTCWRAPPPFRTCEPASSPRPRSTARSSSRPASEGTARWPSGTSGTRLPAAPPAPPRKTDSCIAAWWRPAVGTPPTRSCWTPPAISCSRPAEDCCPRPATSTMPCTPWCTSATAPDFNPWPPASWCRP
mmetsp:Transcript_2774/g.3840  ORF Transcript_2774/g.3840 Transcript_2774/m.3840 type:complete len:208 (+) Transcript_2774:842-1465(+)